MSNRPMTDNSEAYQKIQQLGTSGPNYDVTNQDILNQLAQWEKVCSFNITDVEIDSVMVQFNTLPVDLDQFAREIYEFCPDVIDQHYGCFDEMIEAAEEVGEEIPEYVKNLMEGIDLNDENFGFELLKRDLKLQGTLHLWWD